MKNKQLYKQAVIHKLCVYLLLFAFVFIALAQALHVHNSHNHAHNTKQSHFTKHQIGENASSTCQICQFSLNQSNGQILPSLPKFSFKSFANTLLLQTNYVAFCTQKLLSLFSGSSPPTS